MSIRITVLTVLLIALGLYAWRDWFVALCGLILMMALIEHPDMPKGIMDIQGLNPWNMLMADVGLAWFVSRRREGLHWDMPRYVNVLLLLYLGVVLVGFMRMMDDRKGLEQYTTAYLVSEYLINTVKWVIPGLLIFDGCRTRRRCLLAMAVILGFYLLLAVQVIRYVPANALTSGSDLTRIANKLCMNEVGFHRVNLSMLLSGGSWAMLATLPLAHRRWHKVLIVTAAMVIAYGQALTGGRMGYVTWGGVGLVLCLMRFRKLVLFFPVAIAAVLILAPGVVDRMMLGVGVQSVTGQTVNNDSEMTSGRTVIWPYVIDKIGESPAIGFGREAMVRTGTSEYLMTQLGEGFPHPHNAYLECLLDNGVAGFLLIMPFYLVVLFQSGRLLLDYRNPIFMATGGVTLALVLALLIASMGSQTFYPREGAVAMWAAIGLMFRVSLERKRMLAATAVHGLSLCPTVWRGPGSAGLPASGVRA